MRNRRAELFSSSGQSSVNTGRKANIHAAPICCTLARFLPLFVSSLSPRVTRGGRINGGTVRERSGNQSVPRLRKLISRRLSRHSVSFMCPIGAILPGNRTAKKDRRQEVQRQRGATPQAGTHSPLPPPCDRSIASRTQDSGKTLWYIARLLYPQKATK